MKAPRAAVDAIDVDAVALAMALGRGVAADIGEERAAAAEGVFHRRVWPRVPQSPGRDNCEGAIAREHHAEAGLAILEPDREAVQAGDRLDQREAEAAAGGRAAAVEAIEAVEHLVALGLGNAGAVVGDLDLEAGPCLAQRQRHRRAGRRVAQRVLDQVRDHLGQELAVAGEVHAVFDLVVERVVGVLGGRLVGLADAAHQVGEVDLGEGALLRAGLDLGDAQQGGEGFQQLVGLLDGGVGRGVVVGGGGGALAGVLEVLAQAAERRAQVVGDVARHLAQPVHELLDAARAWR